MFLGTVLLMTGALFGATPFGGHHLSPACYENQCGTVYEVSR